MQTIDNFKNYHFQIQSKTPQLTRHHQFKSTSSPLNNVKDIIVTYEDNNDEHTTSSYPVMSYNCSNSLDANNTNTTNTHASTIENNSPSSRSLLNIDHSLLLTHKILAKKLKNSEASIQKNSCQTSSNSVDSSSNEMEHDYELAKKANTTSNETFSLKVFDNKNFNPDENDKRKKKRTNNQNPAKSQYVCRNNRIVTNNAKSPTYNTCYLLQQYFIYLIFCSIIICTSFGLYYTNVTLNLKLDTLEKKLNERINKRLAIKVVAPSSLTSSKSSSHNNEFDEENYISEEFENFVTKDKQLSNLKKDIKANLESKASSTVINNENFFFNSINLNELKGDYKDTQYSNKDYEENSLNLVGNNYFLEKSQDSFVLYPVVTKVKQIKEENKTKDTESDEIKALPITQSTTNLPKTAEQFIQKKTTSEEKNYNYEANIENDDSDEDIEDHIKILNRAQKLSFDSKASENNEVEIDTNGIDGKQIDLNAFYISDDSNLIQASTTTTESVPLVLSTTTMFNAESTKLVHSSKLAGKKRFHNKTSSRKSHIIDLNKIGKIRHRKRLEIDLNKNLTKKKSKTTISQHHLTNHNMSKTDYSSAPVVIATQTSQSITITEPLTNTTTSTKSSSNSIFSQPKCSVNTIGSTPHDVVFMGVFHCAWMNDINGSEENLKSNYYITKSYKGSTVTICQNSDELKTNRCYRNLQLKHAWYGTGNVIYKDYLFYNQDGSNNLVSHYLLESNKKHQHQQQDVRIVSAPDDAECCNTNRNNLYSIKHSGYFDFEVDESGLWLIYKKKKSSDDQHENDIYVIAKIDENNLRELKILHKWYIKVDKNQSIVNMFISCGQLYALRGINSPASIYKLCDLYNDFNCSDFNYENYKEDFNLTISSRQITSLSYNPDKKLLYMVDGGSFVFYKMQVLE